MIPGAIEGANCILRGDGDRVRDLHALRVDEDNTFVTAWYPTPDELKALNAGEPVMLFVYGTGHPPVMLGVRSQ